MNKDQIARLIAFYLPQYHTIPENDEWWGEGFTEWTNVVKAKPLFPEHYQPHVPTGLGYYDLRSPEVLKAQADMAKEAGISGFCYYHYWFNGKLLLETPLHAMLESGEPDFPFCLCWANEQWTRAWDGQSGEILIDQSYNEDSEREHIRYLSRFFQDKRYIRIDGKPLLLVYRANQIPDPLKITDLWRAEARQLGIGELYLCRVESFSNERDDPTALGFDAAVEFQPDWTELPEQLQDSAYGDNKVYSYKEMVCRMITKVKPPYKRFQCVTPSWDNSPRRKNNATIFVDSTSQSYEMWLYLALQKVKQNDPEERLVFINAWNEWGEGSHLEPDEKHGTAYLEATANALRNAAVNELEGQWPPLEENNAILTALLDTIGPNHILNTFKQLCYFKEIQKLYTAALQDKIDEQAKWALFLDEIIKQRNESIVSLQKEYEERTAWALRLKAESDERGERIVELQKGLEERTAWALNLQKELEERTAWALNLQKELEERTAWALNLNEEVNTLRAELASSREAVRALTSKFDDIQNSMSWKITSPLRKVYAATQKNN